MRLGSILKLAAVGFLVLVIALVAVAKSVDGERYRQVLAQAVHAATGAQLRMRGPVRLTLSLTPALVADDIVLSNPSWASRPDMLTVRQVRAEIGLMPLLFREVRVHKLVLTSPDLLLEQTADGRANWQWPPFDPARMPAPSATGTPTSFHIEHVEITDGRVEWRDLRGDVRQSLEIAHLTADADTLISPIGVKMAGRWNDKAVDFSAVLGSVDQLLAPARTPAQPYPVKLKMVMPGVVATLLGQVTADRPDDPQLSLKLTADAADIADVAALAGWTVPPVGAARLAMTLSGRPSAPALGDIDAVLGRKDAVAFTVKGDVKRPLQGRDVKLLVTAEGESLAGFNKLADLDLPAVGPVKLSARLADDGADWRLGDLKARLGESDLAGDISVRLDGPRPAVQARLSSVVVDLGGWLSPHGEPPSAEAAAERLPSDRVFPDHGLPLTPLKAFDARLDWHIDRVSLDSLVAHQVSLQATLAAGRLSWDQTIEAIADGRASANLVIDAAATPPAVGLRLDLNRVQMGDALADGHLLDGVEGGRSDLHLSLRGRGDTPHAIMSHLNGETQLVVDHTRLGEGMTAELLRQLNPAGTADSGGNGIGAAAVDDNGTGAAVDGNGNGNGADGNGADLRCLVSRFTVTEGLAKSEALIFDTPAMTVDGVGSVQLGSEALDLTLTPRFKDAAQTALAAPLDIGGTLAEPMVGTSRAVIVRTPGGNLAALSAPNADLLAGGADEVNPCLAALSPPGKGGASGTPRPAHARP